MPSDDNLPIPAITVLHGTKSATVMELEQPLTTFVTLSSVSGGCLLLSHSLFFKHPHENIPQQPHAIAALMKGSLMIVDLLTPSKVFEYVHLYLTFLVSSLMPLRTNSLLTHNRETCAPFHRKSIY